MFLPRPPRVYSSPLSRINAAIILNNPDLIIRSVWEISLRIPRDHTPERTLIGHMAPHSGLWLAESEVPGAWPCWQVPGAHHNPLLASVFIFQASQRVLEEFAFLKQLPAAPSGWQPLSGLIRSDLSGAMFEQHGDSHHMLLDAGIKREAKFHRFWQTEGFSRKVGKVLNYDFYKAFIRTITTGW